MKSMDIKMNQWLGANERTRVQPSDQWYLKFANEIYPVVRTSAMYRDAYPEEQMEVSIALAMYFQDAIAQTGGWKVFADGYYSLYKTYLPFYELTDSYVPDEINPEDIAFMLWTQCSHYAFLEEDDSYTLQDPYDEGLLELARQAYEMMDKLFEEAPICPEPSTLMWVIGADVFEMPFTPLPEITPGMKLKPDVERFLAHSGGKPLLYFATYKDLCQFFVDVLKWQNSPSALLPELKHKKEFVVYANAKGILVAHSVAAYFCEAHNPMYDARRAATEGYRLFCRLAACPIDLLKYGMEKGLLPDVQLPFPRGKEILRKYWDFIARYYLCEYYEGL